jgi:hypothetical protein
MKQILHIAVAVALFISLASPSLARATSYEDSLQDCAYPVVFDLTIMRTMSFSMLLLGTGLFAAMAPWAILTATDDVGKVADALIGSPARFTFARPLGACGTGVGF